MVGVMSSTDYYILEGHELRVATWEEYVAWVGQGFEETKRVAKDTVGDAEVSTVFLMIDHNWGDGPPVLFETMVFGPDMGEPCWRYTTWDKAKAGHDRVVAALKAGETLDDLDLDDPA
jgi:hypothetical protein